MKRSLLSDDRKRGLELSRPRLRSSCDVGGFLERCRYNGSLPTSDRSHLPSPSFPVPVPKAGALPRTAS